MRIVQLEWKRVNKRPYIVAGVGIMALCLLCAMLFLFLPDSELDIAGFTDSWEQVIALVSCVTLAGFAILGAVINAKVILEEYTGKRVLLLFSYPVPRAKLFGAKVWITWGLTAGMAFVNNTAVMLTAGLISFFFHGMEAPFDQSAFIALIAYSLGMSVTAGCVGIIALWFGFWKSSVPACIVASLVIVMPVTNLFSANVFLRAMFVIVTAVMVLIGLGVYGLLNNRVKRMEVL